MLSPSQGPRAVSTLGICSQPLTRSGLLPRFTDGGERPEEGKRDVSRVTQLVRYRAGCEPQGACVHTAVLPEVARLLRAPGAVGRRPQTLSQPALLFHGHFTPRKARGSSLCQVAGSQGRNHTGSPLMLSG